VGDRVRLDLRRLLPVMLVGIALSPERQDQQNVRKLSASAWPSCCPDQCPACA